MPSLSHSTISEASIINQLAERPFIPHPALRNAHAQTLAGHFIPRRFKANLQQAEARLFDTAPGVRVLAHCSWQEPRTSRPALILVHGMEGSTDSRYMLGTAEKALAAGFSVVRVNYRNCGGTEHLTPTLYHAGLTGDLGQVIRELIEVDGLSEIYLIGFSLGGNIALKLAGEYADNAPHQIRGVVGVSASIDLAACADAIELRRNIVYSLRFVWSLRGRIRRKAELFPDRYDRSLLDGVWTIRKFDDAYVAPHFGFRDSADYYERASAIRVIDRVKIPTLIIHAKDDPFIPFSQMNRREVTGNPNIFVVGPDQGGHVGFISADGEGERRFWSESTAVRFVELMSGAGF